jgi:hypothetical protein
VVGDAFKAVDHQGGANPSLRRAIVFACTLYIAMPEDVEPSPDTLRAA